MSEPMGFLQRLKPSPASLSSASPVVDEVLKIIEEIQAGIRLRRTARSFEEAVPPHGPFFLPAQRILFPGE